MANNKNIIHLISEKLERYAFVTSEFTFAGIVVGAFISKDIPYDRTALIFGGFAASFILFAFGIFFAHLNNKS
jgi:hypothetical protein